jgi:hypothetical protein
MEFELINMSGSRLIGAITKIGHIGPKHHGIIIGKNKNDNQIYVAEHMHSGYQLATIDNFKERYLKNSDIIIKENNSHQSDFDVAQNALTELHSSTKKKYNLLTNNCESFVNKVTYGHSVSKQAITSIGGILVVSGLYYLHKKTSSKI